jgi:hypothetical protein
VEHVHQVLMGRKVLQAPQDVDDPLFTARRRAWLEQRREVRAIAERFATSGFNLKEVFKAWAASPFYRVDGLAVAAADPVRKAELDDLGLVHLLSPEQVERKILAVFGRSWGKLKDKQTAILYGGIDAKEVTQRLQEPSGAMGAIQRILANDVACQTVPRDFAKPAAERRLFPGIEPDVVPGTPESGAKIRAAIAHLHRRLLGREDGPEHPGVARTAALFEGILEEASAKKGLEPRESYFCRAQDAEGRSADPKYTLRAWRAVVTYLLRRTMKRREFLSWCGAAGLGVSTPLGLGAAQSEPAPYEGPYVAVFNASGGWDTTYLMDPKGVNGINRLYKEGDILTEGAHRYAPIAKHAKGGMSNEDFFKKYGKELLVLHGLDYSVNNHDPCARYMATGKLDSLAYPTFAALAAACKGTQYPLAFLTFGNYSTTGNLVPMARVPYLQSLGLLANADAVGGNAVHPYHDPFVQDRIEKALKEQAEGRKLEPRLPREERAESMLFGAQLNSKALQRVTPWVPKVQSKERLAQQADIALAAFKAGVCVSANLSIGQFDSHNNNDEDQMKLIPEFLAGVDHLLRRAEELGIREKMIVVLQSEMGRTPDYNKGNGKDHWSVGSMMFMGAGIKGGRVIGATDEKQFLVPLNPKTLAVDKEKGIRVRPEHVHRMLRELLGTAEHAFAKQFPLGTPEPERLEGFWG